jgi:hypothetical protein
MAGTVIAGTVISGTVTGGTATSMDVGSVPGTVGSVDAIAGSTAGKLTAG